MNAKSLFFFVFAGLIAVLSVGLTLLGRTNRFVGLRRFLLMDKDSQSEIFNRGWRIKSITSKDSPIPKDFDPGWSQPIALLGGIMFLTGIGVCIMNEPTRLGIGVSLFTIGLVTLFLFTAGAAKLRGRTWPIVSAKCVDVEIRILDEGQWDARIVCEYDFRGNRYRGTPSISDISFNGELAVQKFLNQRISSGGACNLKVNPADPLDTILTETR